MKKLKVSTYPPLVHNSVWRTVFKKYIDRRDFFYTNDIKFSLNEDVISIYTFLVLPSSYLIQTYKPMKRKRKHIFIKELNYIIKYNVTINDILQVQEKRKKRIYEED